MNNIHNSNEPPDFSLVLGGPLFQLLVRSRLTSPALELMKRRIVFISLFAWLPLLLLSLVEGKAWGGVGLPFLYDLEMQARFLVALPLLIAAELLVHQWLRPGRGDSSLIMTSSPQGAPEVQGSHCLGNETAEFGGH